VQVGAVPPWRHLHGQRRGVDEHESREVFAPGRQTSFFMGNFEDARKRASFSVLGVYYPPEGVATSVGLFDLDADE
jgi:hypothetical protein